MFGLQGGVVLVEMLQIGLYEPISNLNGDVMDEPGQTEGLKNGDNFYCICINFF